MEGSIALAAGRLRRAAAAAGGGARRKHSYTVSCSSAFRDRITALAERRGGNVADLARSVVLMVGPEAIAAFPDPGGPAPGDRETVILKSGPAKGSPWRRKPRLQIRMAPGFAPDLLRRALGLALAIEDGSWKIAVTAADARPERSAELDAARAEAERFKGIALALAFTPLPGGVASRIDALHVLGFAPGAMPDQKAVRGRFRALATIHHPDSDTGDHVRMSQLNEAMEWLRRGTA